MDKLLSFINISKILTLTLVFVWFIIDVINQTKRRIYCFVISFAL